jgi:hypothetical protein
MPLMLLDTTLCGKVCQWLVPHNVVVPGEHHQPVTSHWQTLPHNVVAPGEHHQPVTSHWQTLSHNVVAPGENLSIFRVVYTMSYAYKSKVCFKNPYLPFYLQRIH